MTSRNWFHVGGVGLGMAGLYASGCASSRSGQRTGADIDRRTETTERRSGDPASIRLTPVTDVNPVQTTRLFVATVLDPSGAPVSGVDVEWILTRSGASG